MNLPNRRGVPTRKRRGQADRDPIAPHGSRARARRAQGTIHGTQEKKNAVQADVKSESIAEPSTTPSEEISKRRKPQTERISLRPRKTARKGAETKATAKREQKRAERKRRSDSLKQFDRGVVETVERKQPNAAPPKTPASVTAQAPKPRKTKARKQGVPKSPERQQAIPQKKTQSRTSPWFKAGAEPGTGQPQIVIEQSRRMDHLGNGTGRPFYRMVVTDAYDTAVSERLFKKDVAGKSPEQIVRIAEEIGPHAADIVGFARDRMTGIWINDEYHEWSGINGSVEGCSAAKHHLPGDPNPLERT